MRRSEMTESHTKTAMSIMIVGLLLFAPTISAQEGNSASVPVGPSDNQTPALLRLSLRLIICRVTVSRIVLQLSPLTVARYSGP